LSVHGGGDRVKPDMFEPEPAIRLGVTAREADETRWGLILVVFMRFLAGLWITQGLAQWAVFLLPLDAVFDRQSAARTAAMIFFSVLDLLAAVGLWLATPWGGVLWLFAAVAQVFIAFSLPHFFTKLWVGVDAALILVYFALTWQAGKSARP
jgi:fatty acid desaturase